MGRGLSPLQRWILQEAATHNVLYSAEILAGYFAWEPREPFHRVGEGNLAWWTPERLQSSQHYKDFKPGDMPGGGVQYFSREAIGRDRYNRTMATLTRSLKRLADRGLVTRWWGGAGHATHIRITDTGREWLSVNSGR
jgi:hypothetical protein